MKSRFLPLAIVIGFFVTIQGHTWAAPAKNEITQIDVSGGAITISDGRGGFKTYRTKTTTEVTLNKQRATFGDLLPGMTASITTGDPGVASRIVASGGPNAPGALAKPAPALSKVKVPATSGRENPVSIGTVSAGQKVSVTPHKIWWTGGGTKAGKFCDWHGYEGSNINGRPWMALTAAVGDVVYSPGANGLTFTVPTDGKLVLYANDSRPEDNSGNGQVTVAISSE